MGGEYGMSGSWQCLRYSETLTFWCQVDGSIFFYAPNKGAPAFFAVAFAASGIYHGYQCM